MFFRHMKILFYTPVRLISGGGCERWHCDITSSLKKQFNFNIEIISANLGDKNWDENYLKEQLDQIPYEQIKYPVFFGVLIPTPGIFFYLLKKIKEADAVHFIYGFFGQDILMAILKFISGKKFVVGHHAPIFHSSKFHNLYMKFIARHIMNFFDFHQTLNSQDRDFFKNKWRIKNVHFIPSGVRMRKFLAVKKAKHEGLVFVSVGRYSIQKGFDLALSAISKFNRQHKNNFARFNFVGDGELRPLIQKYAKKNKNISDLGYFKYEKMPSLYSKSDIYFLPSREEPFGLVLVEAWASGIPVLATKTEGPKDMLENGKNGWFIEKISVEGIYQAINSIYTRAAKNSGGLKKMEKFCRETGKRFSINKTAKSMTRAFFLP